MLRMIFVVVLLAIGTVLALQSTLFALCLYLWLAYFRPEQWVWNDALASLDLSIIVGIYVVVRSFFSASRFRFDLRIGLLLLFTIASFASTLLSPNFADLLPSWLDFVKVAIITYLIAILISSEADLRLVLVVIVLSLGFEATKQGWAQLILNPGATNTNTLPFLGDNNGVAVGMLMLLPIAGTLAHTATRRWERYLFYVICVGVLYRAISTYSRGAFLACLVMGLMYLWRSPKRLQTTLAIALAAAIVLPVLPSAFWDRMATINAPADERDESQAGRLYFWSLAVKMANDYPLTGVGFNGFESMYDRYDVTNGRHYSRRSVHSVWFGVLSELGYTGLILFLTILGLSFRACHRVRKRARLGELPSRLGSCATGLETALVAFVVGGSFVPMQYGEMLWHFIGLTMALEAVAVTESRSVAVPARLDAGAPTLSHAVPHGISYAQAGG